MQLSFFFAFVVLVFSQVFCAPVEDEIIDLPNLSFDIDFKQYSGYLDGQDGNKLHYWFTESATPKDSPLMLWLNGGPGCSSVLGLLTELGPFRVTDGDEQLIENPYSWNKVANVLFLESPICVGFSYNEDNKCEANDNSTAIMNFNALQDFMKKFPEYTDRDFYIAGESYGGIYVPTLATLVEANQQKLQLEFKGLAIGNGMLSYEANDNSLVFFARYHALIGDTLWKEMVDNCCEGGIDTKETCNFSSGSLTCSIYTSKAFRIIYSSGLNVYNLYDSCVIEDANTEISEKRTGFGRQQADKQLLFKSKYSSAASTNHNDSPPCIKDSSVRKYLNDPKVKEALHIHPNLPKWDTCSSILRFTSQYQETTSILGRLVKKGVPSLIYNGDIDMACNFIGNQWQIKTLNYTPVKGFDSREWYHNGQVAGFYTAYKEGLQFTTIRGSGHMVPEDKPEVALKMISNFINNKKPKISI